MAGCAPHLHCHRGIDEFTSVTELNKYLTEISPRYGKYAIPLWNSDIRCPAELANASTTSLGNCGISNVAHIENIQVHVKKAGQVDFQAKMDFIYDAIRRREIQEKPVKLAVSTATGDQQRLVESICGVQFVHSVSPLLAPFKRRRIHQQLCPPTGISKFVWIGDEETPEAMERLRLRLQALIGWDEFPSDLELRDVHTRMLFNERLQDEFHRVEISGNADIALQHSAVKPGGFMLEATLLLVEAKKDLSQEALSAAEAKAYMQYVAFAAATRRYVPVLLTDGNIMVLYIHNAKLNAHQRMYWDFSQIWEASDYLAALLNHIALTSTLTQGCAPGQDHQPDSTENPSADHTGPSRDPPEPGMGHDQREHDHKHNSVTQDVQDHDTSKTANHMSLGQRYHLTDMQDADMREALRLARFHPCVTAVYGLPPYAKPSSFGLSP